MEEKQTILDGLVQRLEGAATLLAQASSLEVPGGQPREDRGGIRLLADYYRRVSCAKQRGEPIAWVNFGMIPEIFWAMDITPVYVDNTAGIEAVFPSEPTGVIRFIDVAHEDLPEHVCSATKVFTGALESGYFPKPDVFVHPSHPCDSALAVYPNVCETFGIPYFCVDVPYWSDERSFQYIAAELRRLISFLEKHTGRKVSYEKLRQVMEYSNKAHEYILKLNALRASIPMPCPTLDSLAEYVLFLGLPGTPELVDYCQRAYEITKASVERKEGVVPEERIRLAWILAMGAFDASIFAWLEQEYGAVSIHCVSHITAEPVKELSTVDQMLTGLARKMVTQPMGREFRGPFTNAVENAIGMCRYYKADAAVFGGHIACKHSWATAQLLKDRITDELGVPMFVFELDAFDPRITSPDAIRAKFDEFFQVSFPNLARGVSKASA